MAVFFEWLGTKKVKRDQKGPMSWKDTLKHLRKLCQKSYRFFEDVIVSLKGSNAFNPLVGEPYQIRLMSLRK